MAKLNYRIEWLISLVFPLLMSQALSSKAAITTDSAINLLFMM